LVTNGNITVESINQNNNELGYIPLCSLLAKYRPNLDSFLSQRKAFISVDGLLYNQYRGQLIKLAKGRRILGISWKSHVASNTAKIKGTDFSDWINAIDDQTLVVNLQYGSTQLEQNFARSNGLDMISFNSLDFTKDLEHWLALSAACDGIVCISTSLVHFAGSCGQKVAVVMPHKQGHWSVGVNDTESIIYPNVRIYRNEPRESISSLINRASIYIAKDAD
jgi:hypothetical protein